jgi:hypothetical protein
VSESPPFRETRLKISKSRTKIRALKKLRISIQNHPTRAGRLFFMQTCAQNRRVDAGRASNAAGFLIL